MFGSSACPIFGEISRPQGVRKTLLILKHCRLNKAAFIIFAITQGGPGSASETINIYLYSVAFVYYDVGYGSAIALVFFVIIVMLAAVMLYARQRMHWVEAGA